MIRLGLIGFGFINAEIFRAVSRGDHPGLAIAFVANRTRAALAAVPDALVVDDLADPRVHDADLIIEGAHPDITIAHGERILARADYMPLSVTALADDDLRARLLAAAAASGRRLLLPRGALVGTDALLAWRHMWRDVTVTFRKHPRNLDLSRSGLRDDQITTATAIYDGPVRGIAPLYPRNVNTMVTCALATIGLDRCRARLIADPALDHAVAEIEAWGTDGSTLATTKRQPAVGVSGTEMVASTLRSVLKATGQFATLDFV